jgi:hypothetical protein
MHKKRLTSKCNTVGLRKDDDDAAAIVPALEWYGGANYGMYALQSIGMDRI